jgi:hypothetical protein
MNHKHPHAVCPLFVAVVLIPAFLAALPLLIGEEALWIVLLGAPAAFALAFADLRGEEASLRGLARTAGSLAFAAVLCGLASLVAVPYGRLANGYHDRVWNCWLAARQESFRIQRDRARDPYLELQLNRCAEKFDVWVYLLP